MPNNNHPISKLDFLLGEWKLEYRIPKSIFSEEDRGTGVGKFRKILNDKYVSFDYCAELTSIKSSAHAIFAWDEKSKLYRYWWFESSGNFLTASCNFANDYTLSLSWHDSLLFQTFQIENTDKIILHMKIPVSSDKFEIILEVIFIRR
jgi:hypothetical protein